MNLAKPARIALLSGLLGSSLATSVLAQQNPPAVGLPFERGVYYRLESGWVSLSRTVLLPIVGGATGPFLNVGHRGASAELPGPQALVRSTSGRPTFYVRGFSPAAGLYLVRTDRKSDHRTVHLSVNRHLDDGPQFHKRDLFELEIQAVSADVISVRPRNNLAPGEYVIVPPAEPQYRWIHFGYGFGVPMGASGS